MGVILDAAISNRPDVICIGDLNADILNPMENSKQGRTLLDICDIYDLHNLIMEPTRISSTRKSCLDVFLTNAPKFGLKSGTYESGLSDHMLIYTVLNTNLMKPKTTLIKGRSFKNFNEDEFNNDLRFVPFNLSFSKLKFDAHVAIICRKVSSQVNALNRLKNMFPLKTKQSLYRSFILSHFYYCSQVWHHCGKRNTRKLEKVNERALRYVFKDKISSYEQLLKRMSSQTLQNRRIQDMLCTINNCLSNKAPPSITNLVSSRSCSYNLRGENMLALPKVNTTKYGLKSWRYFATKIWNDLPNEIRATAGKNEFV